MGRPQMSSAIMDIGAASRLTTISVMRADSIGTQLIRDIAGEIRSPEMRRQIAEGIRHHMIATSRRLAISRNIAGGISRTGTRRW
jgi:hypothetical protein